MKAAGPRQIPLPLVPLPEASFQNFVAGPNTAAVAAVKHAATRGDGSWPFLWGKPGCGKTHLLSAAISQAGAAGRRVGYLAASVLAADSPRLLDDLDGLDLVCLDDIDCLVGDERWERALFNLYNSVKERGAVMIVSSGCRPRALSIGLPDLRSRLNWGTTLALKGLSDEDKISLLRCRASARGSRIDDEVVHYLMSREQRSVAHLIKALDTLIEAGFSEKRRITIPLARAELAKSREQRP